MSSLKRKGVRFLANKIIKKEVAYKDTFDFKLFPKYEYTKLQKKRLILTQGRIEHFRKAIKYADALSKPNKISLLYMIGYSDSLQKTVMKTSGNVVVLCAKIPKEILEIYDKYQSMLLDLKSRGIIDGNGNFADWYINERDTFYKYYKTCNKDEVIDRKFFEAYRKVESITEEYLQAEKKIKKYYKRYTIIDKLHPVKTIDHTDLDRIIKRYFPKGRECCGMVPNTHITLPKNKKAYDCGLARRDANKLLGITSEKSTYDICKQNIKRIQMNINTELRDVGYINLWDTINKMREPPYGWDSDPHAAYCLGYAMSYYLEGYYIYDTYGMFEASTSLPPLAISFLNGELKYRWEKLIYLTNENGWRLSNRLAKIFDINAEPTAKATITKVRSSIEKHTRFPISMIDEGLSEIIGDWEDTKLISHSGVNDCIHYLSWDKCEKLHEEYQNINNKVYKTISETYPSISEKDLRAATTQCSGWLWGRQTFLDSVSSQIS